MLCTRIRATLREQTKPRSMQQETSKVVKTIRHCTRFGGRCDSETFSNTFSATQNSETQIPTRTWKFGVRRFRFRFRNSDSNFWKFGIQYHIGTILVPYRYQIGTRWVPYLYHIGTISVPYGSHTGTISVPYWHHIGTILIPYWYYICTILVPV